MILQTKNNLNQDEKKNYTSRSNDVIHWNFFF